MAADVGRDTLRSAADATWQPEMIYGHSRVPTATRCCTCYHQRSVAQRLWYCFQLCLFVTLSVCLSVNTITPEPLKIIIIFVNFFGHNPAVERAEMAIYGCVLTAYVE